MKRIIINLLLLTALLCPATPAQADPLDGLIVADGWVSGMTTGVFGVDDIRHAVKIDCPLPEAPYPAEILTLTKGYVSKKQMQTALKAAGQRTEGRFVNKRGCAIYTGDWRTEAAADISAEDAAAQAVRIGLAYFEALGVEVDPVPRAVSRPYDDDAWMAHQTDIYTHWYSDPSTFLERARANRKRRMQYEERQPEYTVVEFDLCVDGMRLWGTPSYPAHYADDPDAWVGMSVGASVTVSDSGVLVEASCELFDVKARRPVADDAIYTEYLDALAQSFTFLLPADDGFSALHAVLSGFPNYAGVGWREEGLFQNKYMTEPVVAYGSTPVVTGIKPYLSAISESEWAPLWHVDFTDEFEDGWRTP